MFTWMEATNWAHLPAPGALEDQDELLMNNIFAIRTAVSKLKNPGR